MGNNFSDQPFDSSTVTKVVLSDGRVQELKEPTTAAELMLEHPQHVVIEFDPWLATNDRNKMIKKRIAPLPADKTLETRKVYMMLPAKRGGAKHAALTSEEACKVLLRANMALRSSGNFVGLIPWLASVRSVPGGNVVAEKKPEKKVAAVGMVEEEEGIEGMRPEYLSRQLSGRGWKPSLDTIKEKKVKRKISHWLF